MYRSECFYFQLPVEGDEFAVSKSLAWYRQKNMQLLSLDKDVLNDYLRFSQHVAKHIQRDAREAAEDSSFWNEDESEFREAQFAWSGATRRFECECMAVEVRRCVQCQEVSLYRCGRFSDLCTMCKTKRYTRRTEDVGDDADDTDVDPQSEDDDDTVHMYSPANKALPPPAMPGAATLTDSEQAVLSPILPYIRVTRKAQWSTTRGAAYGHTFIVPQDVNVVVKHLPRLPDEVSYAVVSDASSNLEWEVNVPRLVCMMRTMAADQILRAVFAANGVELASPESAARVQEWDQRLAEVPRIVGTNRETWEEFCSVDQFRDADADDSDVGGDGGVPVAHGAGLHSADIRHRSQASCIHNDELARDMVAGMDCVIGYLDGYDHTVASVRGHIRQDGRVSDTHPDLFALMFPYLNFGSSDFFFSLEARTTSFNSRARWLKHMVLADGRFASHKLFAFVAQNWVQRAQVNSSAAVYVRKNSWVTSKSIEEIRTDVDNGDFSYAQDVFVWSKTITGSVPYWRDVRGRVQDFYDWKWYQGVPLAGRYLQPNFCEFPDCPLDLDLDLTAEENDLIGPGVPRQLVYQAAHSEKVWSELHDEHVEDTERALEVFLYSLSELKDIVAGLFILDAHDIHVIRSALSYRVYDVSTTLRYRAECALLLGQVIFLEQYRGVSPEGASELLDYVRACTPQDEEELLEMFLATTHCPEVSCDNPIGAYLLHQYTFASMFRERSQQLLASSNPSLFVTGSMAELHWPDLWRVMLHYVRIQSTHATDDEWVRRVARDGFDRSEDRVEALYRYPHISTSYFRIRTEIFFDIILKPVLGVDDYILRFEFADGRGEIHFHGLLYTSRFPIGSFVDQGDTESILRFARTWLRLSAQHPTSDASQQRYHPHANPSGERRSYAGPGHPSKCLFATLDADEVHTWDVRMCNENFHHSCSRNSYCLRDRRGRNAEWYTEPGAPGDRCHTCRFGFHANDWRGKSSVHPDSEHVTSRESDGIPEVVMARNCACMVQHSRFFRRAWKANCDCSLIVDPNPVRIENYVVGYITKEGDATREYNATFRDMMQSDDDISHSSVVRRLMMTVLGHRDKPAQEVLYTITGNPLYLLSCKQGSVVSLSDVRRVVSGDIRLGRNVVDRYVSERAGHAGVSLYDYAMSAKEGFVCLSGRGRAPCFWPVSERFCKNALLLHYPWCDDLDPLRSTFDNDTVFSSARTKFMHDFLYTAACPKLVYAQVTYAKLLHDRPELRARNHYSVKTAGRGTLASFLKAFGNRSHDTDLQRNYTEDIRYPRAPPGYDWHDIRNWTSAHNIELDFDRLTRVAAYAADGDDELKCLSDLHPLSSRTVGDSDQVAAIGVMVTHLHLCHTLQDGSADLMRFVLLGAAGSGKTYVLTVVRACTHALTGLPWSVLVLTPTGAAASVVDGETVHRGLGIRVDLEFLLGARAEAVASRLAQARILVVDEMSMLDQVMFAKIELSVRTLVRNATGQAWGGFWLVVLSGDFVQLPPVTGTSLFCTARSPKELNRAGQALYRQFDCAIVLQGHQRTDASASDLRTCLQALRTGDGLQAAQSVLNARCLTRIPTDDAARFAGLDAMHFVAYNADRIRLNIDHLAVVSGPVAEVHSQDQGHSSHLEAADSAQAFSGLQPVLWLGAGVRVTLCRNVRTKLGLTKGKYGTVVHVHYAVGRAPPALPALVFVKMDKDVHETLANIVLPGVDYRNVVPFAPVTMSCRSSCCTRKQLPLELCHALTVHKSQGATISRPTVVHLSQNAEAQFPGILYTALSRFPNMESFALALPLERDVFLRVRRGLAVSGRRAELKRLSAIDARTRTRYAAAVSTAGYTSVVNVCLESERARNAAASFNRY